MAMRMWDALPPYFGGKRKLVGAIFKLVPPAGQAPRLLDCFLGGGAVSLYAKARGYQVACNDLAERSHIIGRALIENTRVRLTETDVLRLYRAATAGAAGFATAHFSPQVFLSHQAAAIDGMTEELASWPEGPKRDLGRLLLVKFIFAVRPYSKFSSPGAFNLPMEERRIEYIKQRTYHQSIKTALKPTIDLLRAQAEAINAGILDNGQVNTATRGDVMDFLARTAGDVAYFDPPYAETLAYEEEYHVLDQVLAGRTFQADKSGFSTDEWRQFMAAMFAAARHIPLWVLSFGSAGGKVPLTELVELMARHRRVTAYRLKYQHVAAVASEEHRKKNEEYIVVGRADSLDVPTPEAPGLQRVEPAALH